MSLHCPWVFLQHAMPPVRGLGRKKGEPGPEQCPPLGPGRAGGSHLAPEGLLEDRSAQLRLPPRQLAGPQVCLSSGGSLVGEGRTDGGPGASLWS